MLDDAIKSNRILYPKDRSKSESDGSSNEPHSHGRDKIDHDVIIRYIPFVGDSKRAIDEYSSQIFMNGVNTIMSYNISEDSLLAVPIMIDMIILGELFTRMKVNKESMGPVFSYLSFFFKAPMTNHREYVVNSFSRQRETLLNFLKAAAGIPIDSQTLLSFKY